MGLTQDDADRVLKEYIDLLVDFNEEYDLEAMKKLSDRMDKKLKEYLMVKTGLIMEHVTEEIMSSLMEEDDE